MSVATATDVAHGVRSHMNPKRAQRALFFGSSQNSVKKMDDGGDTG
jgi:hypothetical protein